MTDKRRALIASVFYVFLVLFLAAVSSAEERERSKKAAFVRLDACCEESVRPAVERRIQGELAASGLTVVPVPKKKGERLENALEKALVESGADTAVALHLSKGGEVLLSMVFADGHDNDGGMTTVALGRIASESEIDIAAIKTYEAVVAELDGGLGTQPSVAVSKAAESHEPGKVDGAANGSAATPENPVSKAVVSEDIVPNKTKSPRNSKRDERKARRAADREAKEARRASKRAEKETRSSPQPPEKANRDARSRENAIPMRRLGLAADFRLQWSGGGVGPMGAAGGGILAFVTEHFVLGAMAHGTAAAQDIQGEFATSSVRLMLGRIFAAWMFRPKAILRPLLGVEVGAGYLKTEGKSDEPIDLKTERALLFYAGGVVTLSIRLGSRTALPVSVLGGLLPPGVSVEFAGEKVVGFNMFLLEATVGVEVLLF